MWGCGGAGWRCAPCRETCAHHGWRAGRWHIEHIECQEQPKMAPASGPKKKAGDESRTLSMLNALVLLQNRHQASAKCAACTSLTGCGCGCGGGRESGCRVIRGRSKQGVEFAGAGRHHSRTPNLLPCTVHRSWCCSCKRCTKQGSFPDTRRLLHQHTCGAWVRDCGARGAATGCGRSWGCSRGGRRQGQAWKGEMMQRRCFQGREQARFIGCYRCASAGPQTMQLSPMPHYTGQPIDNLSPAPPLAALHGPAAAAPAVAAVPVIIAPA